MFDVKLIRAQLDSRVLAAMYTVSDAQPIERVAEIAGVDMEQLRRSMTRLALRVPGINWPGGGQPS